MASSVIGSLRVLLSLDSAEFDTGSKKVQKSAQTLSSALGDMAKIAGGIMLDRAISGVVSFGREAFESAGKIVDLSEKTGLSIKAVQQFGFIAEQSGSSIEAMALATFRLGVNIEKGGKEVDAALKALGLSLGEVQRLKPEEQFDLIARALSELPDIQHRNAIGVALMGKGYAEAAAPIANYSKLVDEATVSTDESVRALDDAADAWDGFLNTLGAKTRTVLGEAVIGVQGAVSGFSKFFGEIQAFYSGTAKSHREYVESLAGVGKQTEKTTEKEQDRTQSLAELTRAEEAKTKALEAAKKEQEAYNKKIQGMADILSGKTLANEVRDLAAALKTAGGEAALSEYATKTLALQLDALRDKGAKLTPTLEALWRSYMVGTFNARLVTSSTKEFVSEIQSLSPAVTLAVPKLFLMQEHFKTLVGSSGDALDAIKDLGEGIETLPAPPTAPWSYWDDVANQAIDGVTMSLSRGLTDMMTGLSDFSDGWKGIWESLKNVFRNVLDQMLNYFIGNFIQGLLNSLSGSQSGFGNLIGNMFGGGGGGVVAPVASTVAKGVATATGVGSGAGAGTGVGGASAVATAASIAGPAALFYLGFRLAGHYSGTDKSNSQMWSEYLAADSGMAGSFYSSQEYQDYLASESSGMGASAGDTSAGESRAYYDDDGNLIHVPGFAGGSGGFRDFGAGTLAMLHGREAVVPESAVFDPAAFGGGSGKDVHVYMNGREWYRLTAPDLVDVFREMQLTRV